MGLILDYIAGERPSPRERLMKVIRSVRRRWRLKMAIRGAALGIGVALGLGLGLVGQGGARRPNPTWPLIAHQVGDRD